MKSAIHQTYRKANEAVKYLKCQWKSPPRVAIILGSGLQNVIHQLHSQLRIPYTSIPHFPNPTVAGHSGTLLLGRWGSQPVAILEGRVHLYEGYTPSEVVFPVRVLALAGVKALIATCAAGGIAPRLKPGRLMLFSDHLNCQGTNPLSGWHDPQFGPRFVNMSGIYDSALRAETREAARRLRLKCSEGVYAAVMGPSYETPAEVRALRRLGVDAVGMSTVPEVIAARQLGVRVLAIATITNRAAGLGTTPLSHEEVLRKGNMASRDLALLLDHLLTHRARDLV
jgi:purine-nucleoside phosphorylase